MGTGESHEEHSTKSEVALVNQLWPQATTPGLRQAQGGAAMSLNLVPAPREGASPGSAQAVKGHPPQSLLAHHWLGPLQVLHDLVGCDCYR